MCGQLHRTAWLGEVLEWNSEIGIEDGYEARDKRHKGNNGNSPGAMCEPGIRLAAGAFFQNAANALSVHKGDLHELFSKLSFSS